MNTKTKLVIGSIISLLLIGACNTNAQIINTGYGCGGGGYYGGGGGYGGYGGGNGSYYRQVNRGNYSSTTSASYSAPYGNAYNNMAVLGGIAAIISASTPLLQTVASRPQPVVQQGASYYIIQPR